MDAAQAYELDQQCFPAGIAYAAEEIAAYMQMPGFHLGCVDGGILAGMILTVGRRGCGHVITVDVDAGWRRRGIGQHLMRAAEDHYRQQGARGMRLEAAVNNAGALAFYARLGYRVVGALSGYYAPDLDALRLEKRF